MKKLIALMMAAIMVLALAACGGNNSAAPADDQAGEEAAKAAILVVSFGTTYDESRDVTIGAIEEEIAGAYPDYELRRAFTAQDIIDKLKNRLGLEIDNVTEALDRAVADGITTLIVQPTHLMNGLEYNDLMDELENYYDKFEQVSVGAPLLDTDEDFYRVMNEIVDVTKEYDDGETAIVFMGHGTEAPSNAVYGTMQEKLRDAGYENYFVGTVEAEPSLEDVLAAVGEGSYKKVVLRDLMVVAGDHAHNDMAGDEEDSWKSTFEAAGYEVSCVLEGLGQIEGIREIYLDHVANAISALE